MSQQTDGSPAAPSMLSQASDDSVALTTPVSKGRSGLRIGIPQGPSVEAFLTFESMKGVQTPVNVISTRTTAMHRAIESIRDVITSSKARKPRAKPRKKAKGRSQASGRASRASATGAPATGAAISPQGRTSRASSRSKGEPDRLFASSCAIAVPGSGTPSPAALSTGSPSSGATPEGLGSPLGGPVARHLNQSDVVIGPAVIPAALFPASVHHRRQSYLPRPGEHPAGASAADQWMRTRMGRGVTATGGGATEGVATGGHSTHLRSDGDRRSADVSIAQAQRVGSAPSGTSSAAGEHSTKGAAQLSLPLSSSSSNPAALASAGGSGSAIAEPKHRLAYRCTAVPRDAVEGALSALMRADAKLAGAVVSKLQEAWHGMYRDMGPGRAAEALNAVDEHSYSALMKAAALYSDVAAATAMLALCSLGCRVTTRDTHGYGPAHWAAVCAGPRTLEVLAAYNTDLSCGCQVGETPMHRACRMGRGDSTVRLLQLGYSLAVMNHQFDAPLDVAGFSDEGTLSPGVRAAVRSVVLAAEPRARLAVFSHPDCLEHRTRANHQEAPERLTAILRRMRDGRHLLDHEYSFTTRFPHASDEVLCRVHSSRYVSLMRYLDTVVRYSQQPVPFTPMVQRGMGEVPVSDLKEGMHSDTWFSPGSLQAATRAAGAVCAAIDAVLAGYCRNAMCLVRPPGHHAGVEGLLRGSKKESSCGFCIFNSVMIGAAHALRHVPARGAHALRSAGYPGYRGSIDDSVSASSGGLGWGGLPMRAPSVGRVAIVDLDVHHGNGTEECVRQWQAQHPLSTHIFFFSMHLYDVQKSSIPESSDDSDEEDDSPQDGRQSTRSEPAVRVTRSRSRQGGGAGDQGKAMPPSADYTLPKTSPSDITRATTAPTPTGERSGTDGETDSGKSRNGPSDPGETRSKPPARRVSRTSSRALTARPSSVPVGRKATRAARKRKHSQMVLPRRTEDGPGNDAVGSMTGIDGELQELEGRGSSAGTGSHSDENPSSAAVAAAAEGAAQDALQPPSPVAMSSSGTDEDIEGVVGRGHAEAASDSSVSGIGIAGRERASATVQLRRPTASPPTAIGARSPSPPVGSVNSTTAAAASGGASSSAGSGASLVMRSAFASGGSSEHGVEANGGGGGPHSQKRRRVDAGAYSASSLSEQGLATKLVIQRFQSAPDAPPLDRPYWGRSSSDTLTATGEGGSSTTAASERTSGTDGRPEQIQRQRSRRSIAFADEFDAASGPVIRQGSGASAASVPMSGGTTPAMGVSADGLKPPVAAPAGSTQDGSHSGGILKNRLESSPRLPPVSSAAFFGAGSSQDEDAGLEDIGGGGGRTGSGSTGEALTPTASQLQDPGGHFFGGAGVLDASRYPKSSRTRGAAGRFGSDAGESSSVAGAERGSLTAGAKGGGRSVGGTSDASGSGRAARSLLGGAAVAMDGDGVGDAAAGGSHAQFRQLSNGAGRPASSKKAKGWLVGGPLSTVEAGDQLDGMMVDYSFYPGSGDCDCVAANVINVPVPPLWKETKSRPRKATVGTPAKVGRLAARQAIEDRLVPALRAFGPDLILISAGFDGGAHDIGNSGPDAKATPGMNLRPEDFAHITGRIMDVAKTCCPGRVVSVLEGGYGRWKFREPKPGPETRVIRTRRGGGSGSVASTDAGGGQGIRSGGGSTGVASPQAMVADGGSQGSAMAEPEQAKPPPELYINRDNLAENCVAHVRVLAENRGLEVQGQ